MPRPCATCTHAKRREIDHKLILGVTLSVVSREYGIPHNSLSRHRSNHVDPFLKSVVTESELPTTDDLIPIVWELYQRALDVLAIAEAGTVVGMDEDGNPIIKHSTTATVASIREARECVTTIAKCAALADPALTSEITAGSPELEAHLVRAFADAERRDKVRQLPSVIEDATLVDPQ